ncbi:MAG TPA: hypothetical protein VMU15_13025 [Anaeromyxobacter sp.]|nr:hypothetical protein [Anaeromyxobacter sp.]
MLLPSPTAEAAGPRVVVGVLADDDPLAASRAVLTLQSSLSQAFPGEGALAVLLEGGPRDAAEGEPLRRAAEGDPPRLQAGAASPAAALPPLIELAQETKATACALLEPLPRAADTSWLRALLDPVLTGGFDLVAPAYARGRVDGVLGTGIVYPLTRALFGSRLRQPLGAEVVVSARLGEQLLRDDSWRVGGDLWAIAPAVARDFRVAQVFLGPRPRAARPVDVPAALSRVLSVVFREMEQQAHVWMRVRAPQPVTSFGEEVPAEELAPPPDPAPLVAAFALGWQDLRRLWSVVLPPRSLLALQQIPRDPPAAFRMPDALWARVIYDFAVGWRIKAMDRDQLLRSLTPLYLGWVAGFVNEVSTLSAPEVEARVERLCVAFEQEKPYVISRWRWPDRFTP